ncbi:hypothetical protein LRD18_07560 [Halorhodospira halochloris]|uniref:hypothetical protein n=1 Tax=Halorhodospira halochloris TaxID=1052 RepID=UPI001EE8E501|nr:hypothetical protein [Halorhodospira halochloris]MCG5530732.1 hypothetical protein [Halorhodospira halochloris]
MINYLLAVVIIFLLLCVWVAVQHAARRFAQRHPELEPQQQSGVDSQSGCGLCSLAQMCNSNKGA